MLPWKILANEDNTPVHPHSTRYEIHKYLDEIGPFRPAKSIPADGSKVTYAMCCAG